MSALSTTRRSSRAPALCPLCTDPIGDGAIRRCFGCHTRYHLECLGEIGAGCARTGCVGQVLGPRPTPSQRRRRVRHVAAKPVRRRAWLGPAVLAAAGVLLLVFSWSGPPPPSPAEVEAAQAEAEAESQPQVHFVGQATPALRPAGE